VTLEGFDIFDRWGAKVFSTKNPTDCWDGNVGGQPEPPGAYVFVIRAETACGPITRTGSLMLIR
jgi:gliding motility-associated-like protein